MNTSRDRARELDARDPLRAFRQQFLFPADETGEPLIYLCGNSLGLEPRRTREIVDEELDRWARLGVEGHFEGAAPWFSYHEVLAEPVARIVGATADEVVVMNSLTTNLHLLMVSFYRPTPQRHRIAIEAGAFPSDRYAVASQARFHGYDPDEAVVELAPRDGEVTLRTEDVCDWLERHGEDVALLLFGGVNYYSGQAHDMERITAAAHEAGGTVGFDLAHAAGNLRLRLHDWDVDFAAWCTYKYLNSGPGGVGGAFVHERFADDPELPRFAGWWGNAPDTRFEMPERFAAQRGAAGWQLSNAPILAMAAHRAAVEIFDRAGMDAVREKSLALTEYLLGLLDEIDSDRLEVITPSDPAARGSQLSIRVAHGGRELFAALRDDGVIGDFREPDVIRIAAAPLYNGFEDVWRFWNVLRENELRR